MSCLSFIGRVVSEFARFIMFFASIIFLLCSIILFTLTRMAMRNFTIVAHVDSANIALEVVFGLSIYLMVLAIIGILATFFSSRSTIKLLGVMVTLNVIAGVAVLFMTSNDFAPAKSALKTKLIDYQSKYDWDHTKSGDGATQVWDNLQTTAECCGFSSPDDWKASRPPGLGDNLLPISCCQAKNDIVPKTYCDIKKEAFWAEGCETLSDFFFMWLFLMVLAMIGFSLFLAILSAIVICCGSTPVIVRWR